MFITSLFVYVYMGFIFVFMGVWVFIFCFDYFTSLVHIEKEEKNFLKRLHQKNGLLLVHKLKYLISPNNL